MTTKIEGASWSTKHDEKDENPRLNFDQIQDANVTPILNNKTLSIIGVLSFFSVFTHWNFWSIGQYSVGWNSTVFWLGVMLLLHSKNTHLSFKKDWTWVVPLVLICVSFSLFENPWLKLISILVLPFLTAFFYVYGQIENSKNLILNKKLIFHIDRIALSPISNIISSFSYWHKQLSKFWRFRNNDYSKRVLKGLLLLIPSAVLVILLLASADKNFSQLANSIFEPLLNLFSLSFVSKILMGMFFSVLLLSVLFSWRLTEKYEYQDDYKKVDSIVYGILMSGILILYVIFLFLQIEYLIVDTLPIDFEETENLVKSGFWQLFFLSILNVILFVGVYKKTSDLVQIILTIYIFASGLILLLACWRIGLYVYWYGLSYEKYFASYTCLFALFTFIYLIVATMSKSKLNVLRCLVFSFLWFFSVATISPVEQIIYNTNHYLAKKEDTRLNLIHLRFLSADILSNVESDLKKGNLKPAEWDKWIKLIKFTRCNRQWYETNLSLILNCR